MSRPGAIDLDFRPEHYGDFDDPVALALNGLKGQMRREMVRDVLEAQGEQREHYDAVLGSLEDDLLEERAPEAFTHGITSIFGPRWMGGEYLPDMRAGEVEITRVVLASATMDVMSVRARWRGGRYHYTIVDEYQKEYWVRPRTSRRPLTLAQLIGLIDHAEGEDLELSGHSFVEAWWWQ